MSERAPQTPNQEPIQFMVGEKTVQHVLASNGTNRFYEVTENGLKPIASDEVVAGVNSEIPRDGAVAKERLDAAQTADTERLKEHAKAQLTRDSKFSRTKDDGKTPSDDRAPSKKGVDPEDIGYGLWLKENASGEHAGKSVRGSMDEREKAYRREQLRHKARLNMRVKTGLATAQERAYYMTLEDQGAGSDETNPLAQFDAAAGEAKARWDDTHNEDAQPVEGADKLVNEAKNIPFKLLRDRLRAEGVDDDTFNQLNTENQIGLLQEVAERMRAEQAAAKAAAGQGKESAGADKKAEGDDFGKGGMTNEFQRAQNQELARQREEQLEQLQQQLDTTRDEFLRMHVGRSSRAIAGLRSEFSRDKVDAAEQAYREARDTLATWQAREVARPDSVDEEQWNLGLEMFDMYTAAAALDEQYNLTHEANRWSLVDTGMYETDENGRLVTNDNNEAVLKQSRGLNRIINWVADKYANANPSNKRFSWKGIKKQAIVAVAGGVVGVGAGLLLSPLAAGVAVGAGAGVLAQRITRVFTGQTIRKRADQRTGLLSSLKSETLRNEFQANGGDAGEVDMLDLMRHQEDRSVRNNRLRIMGTAALAGVSALGADLLADKLGFGFGGGGKAPANPLGQGGGAGGNRINILPGTQMTQPNGPRLIEGFRPGVNVEAGHGYTQELQDLFSQKSIKLSGEDAYRMYEHLEDKFPGGKFFTNDPSYRMTDTNFGISEPGRAMWRPEVIEEINKWATDNDIK